MFLRYNTRHKDGKEHRYWSVVENRRLRFGHTTQRTVLYLGEVNDTQQAAWRKSLEVFNEIEQQREQICLFPEDRDIPSEVLAHWRKLVGTNEWTDKSLEDSYQRVHRNVNVRRINKSLINRNNGMCVPNWIIVRCYVAGCLMRIIAKAQS